VEEGEKGVDSRAMPARASVPFVLDPVMASPPMRRFDRLLRAVAAKEVTVTLVGESGSGKEVMARLLHERSKRHAGPFVPINCAAIPETLFESELFGHERGAFTGATQRSTGKVAMATGGTLFLDEIGEMPLGLQAKLLRFLEGRRYMRVGGTRKLEADVRLLFATLRPLEHEVRAGRFREDLYYRVQGIVLVVPPLRERGRDIPLLLDAFVAQLSALHGVEPPRLSRAARTALLAHDWPGNVRELRNVVEMLCILHEGRVVHTKDLPFAPRTPPGLEDGSLVVDLGQPLGAIVDRVVDAAIAREGGNVARAARRLGVSARTLQRRRAAGRP
jgi:DNA-binding NtrC family response regulator